jgi:UDP-N-acetylglucosamine acyltransferase
MISEFHMTTSSPLLPHLHPSARLGAGVRVHPLAVVEAGVTLGDGAVLHPFCVVGGPPQHLKDGGEGGTVEIGARTVLREHVQVNRGTAAHGGRTVIGADCLLMGSTHVGHDCGVGNEVILTNGAVLAGHVLVEDFVLLGGMSGVHQFVRIGTMSMVAGLSGVSQDIPPYCLAAGFRARLVGLNEVGIERRGVSAASIRALRKAYKTIFRLGLPRAKALEQARKDLDGSPEAARFVDFIAAAGRRGMARHGRD